MNTRSITMASLAMALAGSAMGQATLYMSQIGSDITPDGEQLVGSLYDANAMQPWVFVLDRMTNTSKYFTDRPPKDGSIYCNADASVITTGMYDAENLAGFGTNRTLAHVHIGSGNWINIGPGPNAYKCDFNVNTAWGIAQSTSEVMINGWTASLCGPFRTWLYNPVNNAFTELPSSVSGPPLFAHAKGTRGNAISHDGLTVCGWDENWNSNFSQTVRRPCVWRKVNGAWTETLLDTLGGDTYGISGDGNVIFGVDGNYAAARWVRSGSTWTKFVFGGSGFSPYFSNFDGSTIVGDFGIWRADLNGGVPMPLGTYLTSLGLDTFGMEYGGARGSIVQGFSSDGNSLILQFTDLRENCLAQFKRGVVDLKGRPCQAPIVLLQPTALPMNGPLGDAHYYGYYGDIINVMAAGSGDVAYQWQKETAPGVWTNLVDDNCDQFNPNYFDVKDANGYQLRLGDLSGPCSYGGNYRCFISNSCGSIVSDMITVYPYNKADFNGDGAIDFFDYDDFVTCFEGGVCPPGKTADFNGDGAMDFFDYDDFVIAFETPC